MSCDGSRRKLTGLSGRSTSIDMASENTGSPAWTAPAAVRSYLPGVLVAGILSTNWYGGAVRNALGPMGSVQSTATLVNTPPAEAVTVTVMV